MWIRGLAAFFEAYSQPPIVVHVYKSVVFFWIGGSWLFLDFCVIYPLLRVNSFGLNAGCPEC
jgi:hypothetical protein